MVCLGLEPRAAGWKAQTIPLSYGAQFMMQKTHFCVLNLPFADLKTCLVHLVVALSFLRIKVVLMLHRQLLKLNVKEQVEKYAGDFYAKQFNWYRGMLLNLQYTQITEKYFFTLWYYKFLCLYITPTFKVGAHRLTPITCCMLRHFMQ